MMAMTSLFCNQIGRLSVTEKIRFRPCSVEEKDKFVISDWKEEYDLMDQYNKLHPDEIRLDQPFNFYGYRKAFELQVEQGQAFIIELSTRASSSTSSTTGINYQPIGVICLDLKKIATSQTTNINLFWIHRSYRKMGYGKYLICAILEPFFRKQKVKTITIEAVDNNMHFWKDACNFQLEHNTDTFFSFLMFKKL